MRIGLTGTIGSGKSLAADVLHELGAVVIDTDEIARGVVMPGTPGWQTVVDTWGEDILASDRTLDRKKLAAVVFADEEQRRKLNGILHPLIGRETALRIQQAPPGKHVIVEVPLLYESGFEKFVETVWVVAADEEVLIKRICERDTCGRREALDRIRAQMPQSEKIKRADVVIYNNGTIEDTKKQILEAWKKIEKL